MIYIPTLANIALIFFKVYILIVSVVLSRLATYLLWPVGWIKKKTLGTCPFLPLDGGVRKWDPTRTCIGFPIDAEGNVISTQASHSVVDEPVKTVRNH